MRKSRWCRLKTRPEQIFNQKCSEKRSQKVVRGAYILPTMTTITRCIVSNLLPPIHPACMRFLLRPLLMKSLCHFLRI